MSKLKTYKFSNLYAMSSGISSKPEQAGHGSPFLSFSTVFKNEFLPEVLPDLMNTSEKEKKTYSIKEGDIFLTRTSETLDELGMSSVAVKDYPDATYSGFLKRLRPTQSDITYPKFMAFYLRSNLFRKTMSNNAVMTLRASLNEQIFSYLELILPSFAEQVKIGDLFFKISEKIKINNKINQDIESMAKLVYDYWFVQFDFPMPKVYAASIGKPELVGQPYKTSGGKMVYNAELKREIPEGWEVSTLGNFAKIKRGKLITEKTANLSGKVKVVSAGINYSYCHDESNREKYTITVSGSGANAGFVNFWREPIFANDCSTIRGNNDFETLVILQFLKLRQEYILNQARGSAQPHVYPKDLALLKILIPTTDLFNTYGKKVYTLNEKISNNEKENQKLAELRDWLLPMLMNGQVTINSGNQQNEQELDIAAERGEVYQKKSEFVDSLFEKFNLHKEIAAIQLIEEQITGRTHGKTGIQKTTSNLQQILKEDRLEKVNFEERPWGMFSDTIAENIETNPFIYKYKLEDGKKVYRVKPEAKKELQEWINSEQNRSYINSLNQILSIYQEPFIKNDIYKIELLNTVYRCMSKLASDDLNMIRKAMEDWPMIERKFKNKAEKFSEKVTAKMIDFIKKKNLI